MNSITTLLEQAVKQAFAACGYNETYGTLTVSKRPDLCDYQCNGAMAAAKEAHKAPMVIAGEVIEKLSGADCFSEVSTAGPGFINLKISETALASYVDEMNRSEKQGLTLPETPLTILVDYGGANVAKPLHVGHLRPAIIGECYKRIAKYMGHHVIGDVHLGDWGLQMGLIIMELKRRQPSLPYFDPAYGGDYPAEAPFTLADLEEIYPTASARSKEDEAFKAEALQATHDLQMGNRGYQALWEHIMRVSLPDVKRNYDRLNVSFELWNKESDAKPYIKDMVEDMIRRGIARYDNGTLIVDVKEETDTKEFPPCIILKSDGSYLYATTDLATLVQRMQDFHPGRIMYVTDKRQEMHFDQVFRTARKAGIVDADTSLEFYGCGTINGKDGKPYKTRSGQTPRLEALIDEINAQMLKKINENDNLDTAEASKTAGLIGLSAIKYADLSNQSAKDYVFDSDRFTSFEGNTGPYILYTIVRIKSILRKYAADHPEETAHPILPAVNAAQKELMLALSRFAPAVTQAYNETAPHKICTYIYELSNAFNKFYHETKILSEPDPDTQSSFIGLLQLTRKILEDCIDMLGFAAPERM